MWTLGGVRIYVQKLPISRKPIIARLQPLTTKSIHQYFGSESPIYKLSGIIVGDTDKNSLDAMSKAGIGAELIGPYGSMGTCLISNIQFNDTGAIWQSIRTDLPCNSPVYDIEAELWLNE